MLGGRYVLDGHAATYRLDDENKCTAVFLTYPKGGRAVLHVLRFEIPSLLLFSPRLSVPARLLYPLYSPPLWYDDVEVAVVERECPASTCRFSSDRSYGGVIHTV